MFAELALKTWGGLNNRVRGWLLLAGVVVFPLLWLYVGAYYATVIPFRAKVDFIAAIGQGEDVQQLARGEAVAGYRFEPFRSFGVNPATLFGPIHHIDRKLRPQTWGPLPSRANP